MNNKIFVVDTNGNQIVAEGVAYIVLSGESYKNEYLFYTLNEVVNGDLTKVYVAKVNNENPTVDDDEWENVKRAMLAIVHKEEILGLSFENIYDEQGNSKTFKVDFPRKIALKIDKLMGLRDEYKIAISNPDSNQDAPAVGNTEFFDKEGMTAGNQIDNAVEVTSAFDGSLNPVQTDTSLPSAPLPSATISVGKPGEEATPEVTPAPSAPAATVPVGPEPETPSQVTVEAAPASVTVSVAPAEVNVSVAPTSEVPVITPTIPEESVPQVTPAPAIEAAPEVAAVPAVVPTPEVAPANLTVTVTPAVEPTPVEDVAPAMPSIVPEPIPGALGDMPAINNNASDTSVDIVDENDFAIPVSIANQNKAENMDSVIFDQIIEELQQIKNQNTEIRESIKRLTNNIDSINSTISALESKSISSGSSEMLNTNTSNTSEEVSAVEMTASGSIIVPKYDEVQQSANQAVNVLTTEINPTPSVIDIAPPVDPTSMIEQPTSIEPPAMIEQPTTIEPAPAVIEPAPAVIEQPTVVEPVANTLVPPTPVTEVTTVPTVETIDTSIIAPPAALEPAPAIIEQQVESQLIPDVPMMNAQPAPQIVVPQFDPNAGLPPVVMPTGVSSGDGTGGIPGMM